MLLSASADSRRLLLVAVTAAQELWEQALTAGSGGRGLAGGAGGAAAAVRALPAWCSGGAALCGKLRSARILSAVESRKDTESERCRSRYGGRAQLREIDMSRVPPCGGRSWSTAGPQPQRRRGTGGWRGAPAALRGAPPAPELLRHRRFPPGCVSICAQAQVGWGCGPKREEGGRTEAVRGGGRWCVLSVGRDVWLLRGAAGRLLGAWVS